MDNIIFSLPSVIKFQIIYDTSKFHGHMVEAGEVLTWKWLYQPFQR